MKEAQSPKAKVHFKLSCRRQTAAEEEQFNAAFDFMLAEWVREELDAPKRDSCSITKSKAPAVSS
jgi:hypothetical protein